MKIKQLAIAVTVLACSGACGGMAIAQTTGGSGGTAADSERNANRSGISEADRGTFEATESTQGSVGSSAEDVSKTLRELRGTSDRQKQSTDMTVENLNKRRNARSRRQAQRSPPPPIHVHFQPAFSIPWTPSVEVAKSIQTRLSHLLEKRARLLEMSDPGSVFVELSDRTATLTGTVRSEYERKLLERMVRIKPGVSAVENFISVQEPPLAPVP